MPALPDSLKNHRIRTSNLESVLQGDVHYAPLKSAWFLGMASTALIGGVVSFTWVAFSVFLLTTAVVLLLGHSLGSHRKLIHNSYQCPKWLEYTLVYFGVQVGLAGPLGLLKQHELRDYAQRLPDCHDYLRHGRSFWIDAWWQLNCELRLANPPRLDLEQRIANNLFYQLLERTWMAQQIPPALLFYALGGWGFVFWGVCARITAGVFGHWLVGYFAHNHGGMRYEVRGAAVQGRNIRFTSLITMGECWHNNHHAFPGSARLGLFAGEWDPGWWTLVVLNKVGLVWDITLPVNIPARVELQARDAVSAEGVGAWSRGGTLHAPVRPMTLTTLVHICICVSKPTRSLQLQMEGPAAILSERATRLIAGRHIPFLHNPGARRLVLRANSQFARGLPALCVALCARSLPVRTLGLALLPVAVGYESIRSAL